jgi:hypothetical protein
MSTSRNQHRQHSEIKNQVALLKKASAARQYTNKLEKSTSKGRNRDLTPL